MGNRRNRVFWCEQWLTWFELIQWSECWRCPLKIMSVDSLKAGNTANMTSRCCLLPAATSVVSTGTAGTTDHMILFLKRRLWFTPTILGLSPRWVHHRPCHQGHEQQLAPRVFLLWHLSGRAGRRRIREERWKVGWSAASTDILLFTYHLILYLSHLFHLLLSHLTSFPISSSLISSSRILSHLI